MNFDIEAETIIKFAKVFTFWYKAIFWSGVVSVGSAYLFYGKKRMGV